MIALFGSKGFVGYEISKSLKKSRRRMAWSQKSRKRATQKSFDSKQAHKNVSLLE